MFKEDCLDKEKVIGFADNRTLDRLIAEHVFGETCHCGSEDLQRKNNPFGFEWLCHLHGNRNSCPPYSTEIYFAWKVFAHFGAVLLELLKFGTLTEEDMVRLVDVEGAERVNQASRSDAR